MSTDPTYAEQLRLEALRLARHSIARGFVPSQDLIMDATSAFEWNQYREEVFPLEVLGDDIPLPSLREYFRLLEKADKLNSRIEKTPVKRRGPPWHELRVKAQAAYLLAYVELKSILRESPELELRLFPPFLHHGGTPLWPRSYDMPRKVKASASEPQPNDSTERDELTREFLIKLFDRAELGQQEGD